MKMPQFLWLLRFLLSLVLLKNPQSIFFALITISKMCKEILETIESVIGSDHHTDREKLNCLHVFSCIFIDSPIDSA